MKTLEVIILHVLLFIRLRRTTTLGHVGLDISDGVRLPRTMGQKDGTRGADVLSSGRFRHEFQRGNNNYDRSYYPSHCSFCTGFVGTIIKQHITSLFIIITAINIQFLTATRNQYLLFFRYETDARMESTNYIFKHNVNV